MKSVALWMALTAVAALIGFALAGMVLLGLEAVLPPFRREDDDTLRQFVPVALAYATWSATAIAGAILAGRWIARRPR